MSHAHQVPESGFDDLVRPFQIDPFALRGRLVRLGSVVDRIVGQHGYPDPVARILGEAVALAAALAGALKYEGIFTLQTKGDGPIRMMVADVTSAGAVRGFAQFDADELAKAGSAYSVQRLLGAGYLAFTVDQGEHTERYQGIVELTGHTLAECIQHYFRQSEQIEAGLRVAVGRADGTGPWRAGAVMLQRLPDEGGTDGIESHLSFNGEEAAEANEDGWRRALILLGTCTDAELLDRALTPDDLLLRLFHEDGVRVYPPTLLGAACRCSRERVAGILSSFTPDELMELKIDGKVVVTCEFCSTSYTFDDAEVRGLV